MNTSEANLRDALADIASHLRVALWQTLPSDDQIILSHMRESLIRAELALGKTVRA